MQKWLDIAEAGLVIAVVVQFAFVLVYLVFGTWWRSFVGQALLTKSAVIALALGVSYVNSRVTYPYQLQIAAVLTWLIAVAVTLQFAALVIELIRSGRIAYVLGCLRVRVRRLARR